MDKDLLSSILITGGTGSFGKAFVRKILEEYPQFKRVVIFSRDELKQWEMQQEFDSNKYPQLRFFLGDIRDYDRIQQALERIDIVVHAAALKQVTTAEYNPMEYVKTNVQGSENIIKACLRSNVKKVIALSTDKAAAPINLYGATKLCADKLFISANNIKGKNEILFSTVRYGNVMGSRGSVIPLFLKQALNGTLLITNNKMTRFNISLQEGVDMVFWAINNAIGGEIFVPKIPSYRLEDISNAIGPNCRKKIIGTRPGEKLHEELITISDSLSTIDLGNYYAILPPDLKLLEKYDALKIPYKKVIDGFSYQSSNNEDFLTVDQIRSLIKKNINPSFKPV